MVSRKTVVAVTDLSAVVLTEFCVDFNSYFFSSHLGRGLSREHIQHGCSGRSLRRHISCYFQYLVMVINYHWTSPLRCVPGTLVYGSRKGQCYLSCY